MNEIRKIHISRQAYAIAVDAYGELKKYLDGLKAQIDDKEVYTEIELRIVELLAERGVSGDKVILADDVTYLKENLGEVSDFEADDARLPEGSDLPRRFMRNPRGQLIGGVANGLASYFGIDPIWFRLAFIVLTLASGFGILLYFILWVIMPEAKTSSDFIQMQGKPVTVESITEFAESKEVEKSIHRMGKLTADMVRVAAWAVLYALAIALISLGILGVAGSIGGAILLITNGELLFDGVRLFPVNGLEIAAVIAGAVAGVAGSFFMMLAGSSIITKKWQLPSWATAGLLTLFFVSALIAVPLVVSPISRVSQRVDDAHIATTRSVPAFTKLQVIGDEYVNLDVVISFEPAKDHSVETTVFGKKDTSLITSKVSEGTLTIDVNEYMKRYECREWCMYPSLLRVVVRGPVVDTISLRGPVRFNIFEQLQQTSLELINQGGASFSMDYAYPDKVTHNEDDTTGGTRTLLEGLRGDARESDHFGIDHYGEPRYIHITRAQTIVLSSAPDEGCLPQENILSVATHPESVMINGQKIDANTLLSSNRSEGGDSLRSLNYCIMVDGSY